MPNVSRTSTMLEPGNSEVTGDHRVVGLKEVLHVEIAWLSYATAFTYIARLRLLLALVSPASTEIQIIRVSFFVIWYRSLVDELSHNHPSQEAEHQSVFLATPYDATRLLSQAGNTCLVLACLRSSFLKTLERHTLHF